MSTDVPTHRGVAADDPRNAGIIAFFRPPEVTTAYVHQRLATAYRGKPAAFIADKVAEMMAKIAQGRIRPPPPLSQPVSTVAEPFYELGTHPDIVAVLWWLESGLPAPCRWVFWGRPALVHPVSGVVFAIGYGSLGYVMRLPADIRRKVREAEARPVIKGNPGQMFDIGPAGPEWCFILPAAPAPVWCLAAYTAAG
jgi:hypothetical protein